MTRILWLDAELRGTSGLKRLLENEGEQVDLTRGLRDAVSNLQKNKYDLVIVEPYHYCIERDARKTERMKDFLRRTNEESRVMLLTSLGRDYLIRAGIEWGIHYSSYYQKPQQPEIMVPLIRSNIALARNLAEIGEKA